MSTSPTLSRVEALIELYTSDLAERNELVYQFARTRDDHELFAHWLHKQPDFQQATYEQIEYIRKLCFEQSH